MYYEPLIARKYSNKLAYRVRMLEAKKTQYSGAMSSGSRKRLSKAVTIMSQASKPRWIYNHISGRHQYHHLSFITLTVSCRKIVSTSWARENLLAPFLAWMRDTKGVKTYVWKLEFQERGQVHYHITTPAFIDCHEIRNKWNSLQHKHRLLDEYAREHGHFNPNSTDVHAVHSKKNMASYLLKELGKAVDAKKVKAAAMVNSLVKAGEIPPEDKEARIKEFTGEELLADGKVWDCSNNLSGANYFAVPMEQWHMQKFDELRNANQLTEVVQDWWSLIYFKSNDPPDILNPDEQHQLDSYLQTILN